MRVYKHSGNVQQQDFSKCIFRQSKNAAIGNSCSVFHFDCFAYTLDQESSATAAFCSKVHSHLMPSNGMLAVKRQLRRNTVISVSPRLAHAKYGISVASVG